MSTDSTNLSALARSKLHLSVGSKDRCSLHRWVLLKNSIVRSLPSTASTPSEPPTDDADEELSGLEDEEDAFMFPDVGKLVEAPVQDANKAEAQWLDSLLETLGDDEEDDLCAYTQNMVVDDDDDQALSPLPSPMSSSDDLTMQVYYPYPYPVPYPPFGHSYPPTLTSLPHPVDEPLPYFDQDDVDDLSVPEAIEDTSDDESDTPPTPSLGRSSSSISLVDSASIPSPMEHSRLGRPHIYVDSNDSYFSIFDIDPLPFSQDRLAIYDNYQEC